MFLSSVHLLLYITVGRISYFVRNTYLSVAISFCLDPEFNWKDPLSLESQLTEDEVIMRLVY